MISVKNSAAKSKSSLKNRKAGKFKRNWTVNKMRQKSPSLEEIEKLKELGEQLESVKYGHYRETYDEE